jgi:hypothetical protein
MNNQNQAQASLQVDRTRRTNAPVRPGRPSHHNNPVHLTNGNTNGNVATSRRSSQRRFRTALTSSTPNLLNLIVALNLQESTGDQTIDALFGGSSFA